jgi:hypothetical protein
MRRRPRARDTVPVLGSDGRTTLGTCEVRKFGRTVGEPYKEITITDLAGRVVARLTVYRLHTRVECDPVEGDAAPVDSKKAVRVAQAALEAAWEGPDAIYRAIVDRAEACARESKIERNDSEFGP